MSDTFPRTRIEDPAMAKTSSKTAADITVTKLSTPRIFLVRMLVFLVLCSLLLVVLYKQIWLAFLANPGLNALIVGVLAIGIILAFRQVIRLYPEISWVNSFRISDPGLAVDRRPTLLAPMAAMLSHRSGRMSISQQTMRHLLDSIATRLDEARDLSRYMTGLLVFLGLLGTFWGLIETVGSVGKVIEGLKVGGDAAAMGHARERSNGGVDERARRLVVELRDHAETAGVAFVVRVVETGVKAALAMARGHVLPQTGVTATPCPARAAALRNVTGNPTRP